MSSCGVSRRCPDQFTKPNEKRIIRVFDLMAESSVKKVGNVRSGRKSVKSGEPKKRRASKKSPTGEGGFRKRRRRDWEICFDEVGVERASKENTAVGSEAMPETSTSEAVISGSYPGVILGSALLLALDENPTQGMNQGCELELEKQKNESIIVSIIEGVDLGLIADESLEGMNPSMTALVSSSENVFNGSVTEENVEDVNLQILCDGSPLEKFDSLLNEIVGTQLPEEKEVISDRCSDFANANVPEDIFDIQSKHVHDGYLALQEAIIIGSLSKAEAALCKGEHLLNDKNHSGKTPLHLAVIYREKEIVRLFLKSKADISLKDEQGNTALHLCIRRKENDLKLYGCFRVLIESKDIEKIINTFNNQGFSPLHTAAIYGAYEEARCMLRKGAEVNLKDGTSGRTALFHAVEQKNVKLIDLLLNNGADMNAQNMSRQTPHMAAKILGKASESKDCKSVNNKYKYFYCL